MFLTYRWPRERAARWGYVAVLAGIVVAGLGQMVQRSTPVDAQRYLQAMASGTQPKLPISVAPDLALEAVEAVEDTIYYSYKTTRNVRTDFDAPSFADTMKSSRLPVICEKMSDLLEAGMSFVSLFDDKDNRRIAAFSVASGDCPK